VHNSRMSYAFLGHDTLDYLKLQVRGIEMKRSSYTIFSSGAIAGLTIKNRLVRAATFEGLSSYGKVTDEILDLYCKLAEGGIGL